MSTAQRGSIIGGIWLVLLGGVFLVQQAMDLGWARAWPLFEARFPRTSDGWASAGYEAAEHRADIRVSGGVGSFRIS